MRVAFLCCFSGYYCCCRPLCAYLCVLGCVLVTIDIAVLLFGLLFKSNNITTTTSITRRSILNVNIITNGDAETGPCAAGAYIISPTGWNFNATITQNYYNNTGYLTQTPTSPGPRGSQSSLLFRQTQGFVPAATRFLTVIVTMTLYVGGNDGSADNIALILYQ